MNCPVCKETKLVISNREGVEIDYCPDCRGVWLDRGELDKIIERSAQISAGSRSDDRRETYREKDSDYREKDRGYEKDRSYDSHEYGYKKKKRGGFLDDIFDF
ncbi:MAG: zf-TFIIB domain-containing protein [Ignavibacteria bacterium]|nr:zf-TFIIB domain-containing protein [Ignavibacteria bacterium]